MTTPLKRILCVEDEPDIRAVLQMSLEMVGGFTVACASSGAEAITMAPGFAPDIILLDVMMPGMDGPTTLQRLRELPAVAATPVVFITAKVQPNEVAQFRALGAVDVVAKPFDPMRLSAEVAAIWERVHG